MGRHWGRLLLVTGFVVCLLVQQSAFVSLPIILGGVSLSEMREFDNPVNRFAVAGTLMIAVCAACACAHALIRLVKNNLFAFLYGGLVVASATWSIHPALTLRRACGYVLTLLIAALLPVLFGRDHCIKLLSTSFAVSGIASLLIVLIAPEYGIMQDGELSGCWQGVFCTKESMGSAMSVAFPIELYLVMVGPRHSRLWRAPLLALFGLLVVMSGSKTALFACIVYIGAASAVLSWRCHRALGIFVVVFLVFALAAGSIAAVSAGPSGALATVGKDVSLTGRSLLWPYVIDLIGQKPFLGWGYGAMWQPDDLVTMQADAIAGFWVPSAHNAFLEVPLQLGIGGLALFLVLIALAFGRGLREIFNGREVFGWFFLAFLLGSVLAGLTTDSLGQGQSIEWLLFLALSFVCSPNFKDCEHRGTVVCNGWPASQVRFIRMSTAGKSPAQL